jgi:hypothetical protein
LAGNVRHPPYEIRRLMETLKSAQGDTDVDESLIPDEATPGDFEVTGPEDKTFGIPDAVDPDPYGVLALQEAGLEIREAGTHSRPTSEQFEFKPSPTSPIYNTFRNSTFRRSTDRSSFAGSRRSSWRTSTISGVLEPRTPTADMSTQTDDLPPPPPTVRKTPPTLPPRTSIARLPTPPIAEVPETRVEQATPPRAKSVERQIEEATPTAAKKTDSAVDSKSTGSPSNSTATEVVEDDDSSDDEDDEFEDEPVVYEVHQAAAPQAIHARVVQVAKPVAPALPVRNPFRNRVSTNSDGSLSTTQGASPVPSPTKPKHSPESTPSLMRGDSTSSLSSVEDNRLEQIGNRLKPKYSHEPSPDDEKKDDAYHSLPESPMKSIPGGFN